MAAQRLPRPWSRPAGLVLAAALVVDGHRVGGDGVGDVRALRVDVDRVRLADVRGQADGLRVRRVGDVDDLQAAPRGPEMPPTPWSWHRPTASVASTMSCVSPAAAYGLNVFWIAPPFGVASTSCWRPSAASGLLTHDAVGACPMRRGRTSPRSVSCTIV